MKIRISSFLLFSLLLFGISQTVEAQKFGYIHANSIMSDLPEFKVIDSKIGALNSDLQKQREQMIDDYNAYLKAMEKEKREGNLTPQQEEKAIQNLQARQDEIAKFEKEMVRKIEDKEAELFRPIYKKMNDAIEAVAKENGLEFILDSGTLLYGSEKLNMESQVKAKLGL